MSDKNWTPGPWDATTRRIGDVVASCGMEWLACANAETDADASYGAHLIAAAPELYEALETARDVLSFRAVGPAETGLVVMIDAALAKDRGEHHD